MLLSQMATLSIYMYLLANIGFDTAKNEPCLPALRVQISEACTIPIMIFVEFGKRFTMALQL